MPRSRAALFEYMPFVCVLENITFCSIFANPFHDFKEEMQIKRADLAPLLRSQRHSERLDLSLVAFFGKQKVAMGVYKGAKCR